MTVLGPGSDWYHEEHIHLDLMERRNNYRICQWNVWDPLPKIAPLMPAARPDEAPPREVAGKADADKSDKGDADEPKAKRATPGRSRQAVAKPRNKKAPVKPALLMSSRKSRGYCDIGPPLPPPCRAICELNGESPCCGSSTTTMVPTFTRL